MKDSDEGIDYWQYRSSQQDGAAPESVSVTSNEVINRIESLVAGVVRMMDDGKIPFIQSSGRKMMKRFTLVQSRSFTSILMVLSYCHSLLCQKRSTTTREVYYFFVTHFKNQRECDYAIWEAAELLGVSRLSLGLTASPKGALNHVFVSGQKCYSTAALASTTSTSSE